MNNTDNTPKPNQETAEPLTVDLFKTLGDIFKPISDEN